MKTLTLLAFAAALTLLPQLGHTRVYARKPHRIHARNALPPAPRTPEDIYRGNAALGGNNANSAYGPNGADSNAEGRTGGGMGGG